MVVWPEWKRSMHYAGRLRDSRAPKFAKASWGQYLVTTHELAPRIVGLFVLNSTPFYIEANSDVGLSIALTPFPFIPFFFFPFNKLHNSALSWDSRTFFQ